MSAGAGGGRVLRLKQGYNPNSSSIGTIVFVMPAALLGATIAFGVAAGLACTAFLRDKGLSPHGSEASRVASATAPTAPPEKAPDDHVKSD